MPIAWGAVLILWFISLSPVFFIVWLLKLYIIENLNNHRRMVVFSLLLPFLFIGSNIIFKAEIPISGFVIKHTLNGRDFIKSTNGATAYFFNYIVKPTSGYYYSIKADKIIDELNLSEVEKSKIKLRNHLAAFYLNDEDKVEYYEYITQKYPILSNNF